MKHVNKNQKMQVCFLRKIFSNKHSAEAIDCRLIEDLNEKLRDRDASLAVWCQREIAEEIRREKRERKRETGPQRKGRKRTCRD